MSTTITLTPPAEFINANQRLHHMQRAILTKAWRRAAESAIDGLGTHRPIYKRARIDRGRLGSTAMSSESLAALNICASCPVRLKCFDYAMRTETASSHTWGIWGGMTAEQRRRLARDAS